MRLLKKIRWALAYSKLESDLSKFCDIEYRKFDRLWALEKTIQEHKQAYLGEQ